MTPWTCSDYTIAHLVLTFCSNLVPAFLFQLCPSLLFQLLAEATASVSDIGT